MNPDTLIQNAIALIAMVPGYEDTARDLSRRRIVFVPDLPDRGQASLLGTIRIGPETLEGESNTVLVSLAGTLIHEHWHTRQNPMLKTISFWTGVFTRSHPMRRYERPAYESQSSFLTALSRSHPHLSTSALSEQSASHASYQACYDIDALQ